MKYMVTRPDGTVLAQIDATSEQDAHQYAADQVLHPIESGFVSWPEGPRGCSFHWDGAALSAIDTRTIEQRAADIRARRDAELALTDWMVTRSSETGAAIPADWRSFRQALRDITAQAGFPDAIVWPAAPDH